MEFPGLGEVLDHDGRDALLAWLLKIHPGAAASARNELGQLIEFPPSVELFGQPLIRDGFPLHLVDDGSRVVAIEAWRRALQAGASTVRVALVNGAGASCHLVDVRGRHGAFIGLIVADAPGELSAALAVRVPVMPRIGRTEKDERGVIRTADQHICRILGCDAADLLAVSALDLIHPDDQARAIGSWMEMLSVPDGATRLRARHRCGDGSWLWMELTHMNQLETQVGVMVEMIDISTEMEALEALHRSEQRLRRLAEALPSGVLHIDRDRRVVNTNARLHALIGVEQLDTVADLLSTVVPDDRPELEHALGPGAQRQRCRSRGALLIPATARVHLCAVAMRGSPTSTALPTARSCASTMSLRGESGPARAAGDRRRPHRLPQPRHRAQRARSGVAQSCRRSLGDRSGVPRPR